MKNGQIGPMGGEISGKITVDQCLPGRRAFRLISSSTNAGSIHNEWQENPSAYTDDPRPGYGTHITGVVPCSGNAIGQLNLDQTNGLDWQPSGNASMFAFDENSQVWDTVLDTEGTNLIVVEPYLIMIRGSRAVDLTTNSSSTSNTKLESSGTIVKGSININPEMSNEEFALIGNPFQATVDLNDVIPGNGYTNFVTIFDPNLGGVSNVNTTGELGGRGGYVTVDITNGNTTVATGISGIIATATNQFLQPNQAFFVQGVPTGDGDPGIITFEESDKAVGEPLTDVFNFSTQPRIFVNLFDEQSLDNLSTPDDGLVIYFSDNANDDVDVNDAPKFFNQDEVIARNENNSLTSFENRTMPQVVDVLRLYTNQYRNTTYVLEIGVQFLGDHNIYLFDKYTNTEVSLNNNASNTYEFFVDQTNPSTVATDRFELRFETSTLGTSEFDLQGLSVYPNPTSDILNIDLGKNAARFDNLELFDTNGRLLTQKNLDNLLLETQLDINAFSPGVYLLKVSSEKEQFSNKVIVE